MQQINNFRQYCEVISKWSYGLYEITYIIASNLTNITASNDQACVEHNRTVIHYIVNRF